MKKNTAECIDNVIINNLSFDVFTPNTADRLKTEKIFRNFNLSAKEQRYAERILHIVIAHIPIPKPTLRG